MGNLTENFTREEMACPCGECGIDVIDWYTLECLQKFRTQLRIPFTPHVNRCPGRNKYLEEKGYNPSARSLHMEHVAVDIPLPDYVDREAAAELALQCGFVRVGLYDWGIHVDTANEKQREGRAMKWDRRTSSE